MGVLFCFDRVLRRRNGTGEQLEISVCDNHNKIEVRLGPPNEGDGPRTLVVELTRHDAQELSEALDSVARRVFIPT